MREGGSSWDNFLIKLKHWEYWPFGIIQLPAIIYYLWLSIRARSLMFFSASNPGIVMGGMLGESKYDVIKKIPSEYVPRTILINQGTTTEDVFKRLTENKFSFPLIFKPDIGERGYLVQKIQQIEDIDKYLTKTTGDFLIQDLIDLPLEFGIFYERKPSESVGRVTSVVMKEMLSVNGDGHSTLQELIFAKERARLQWKKLGETYRKQLNEVVPRGKVVELVSIGNHALGTKFLNGNHLINDKLSAVFDHISKQIPGFYFGRFDLRCQSIEDLYDGRIKILELNGCGAEPAHIYDPDFKLLDGIVVLLKHWRSIFEIARENKRLGTDYITFREARGYYKKFKHAIR